MLPFKVLLVATIATLGQGFQLLRDDDGYAILPPTTVVVKHLSDKTPQENPHDYHVVNTVSDEGEIIRVNLNTHEQKSTGLYRRDYDGSAYAKGDIHNFARTIYNDDQECFNEQDDFEVSECEFDFVTYTTPSNCSDAGGSKYSCVLDVEKSQDSSVKLKNMDNVPALVRCYKTLDDAITDKTAGGACGK